MSRSEAEVARGLLESNGIKATISADDEGGMAPYPFQPSSSGARLLVKEGDLVKAKEILSAFEQSVIQEKPEN